MTDRATYRATRNPRISTRLQPPMRGSQRDTSRLACAAHLRHSIEFAQHEIAYWEGVVKQLTLAAEDMERK